jgi:hypothetical protein
VCELRMHRRASCAGASARRTRCRVSNASRRLGTHCRVYTLTASDTTGPRRSTFLLRCHLGRVCGPYHLEDLLVAVSGFTRPVQCLVRGMTMGFDDLADEPQAGRTLGILGLESPCARRIFSSLNSSCSARLVWAASQ